MVKHTQTIRRQEPRNCLSVFDHFAGMTLKGLTQISDENWSIFDFPSFYPLPYMFIALILVRGFTRVEDKGSTFFDQIKTYKR